MFIPQLLPISLKSFSCFYPQHCSFEGCRYLQMYHCYSHYNSHLTILLLIPLQSYLPHYCKVICLPLAIYSRKINSLVYRPHDTQQCLFPPFPITRQHHQSTYYQQFLKYAVFVFINGIASPCVLAVCFCFLGCLFSVLDLESRDSYMLPLYIPCFLFYFLRWSC